MGGGLKDSTPVDAHELDSWVNRTLRLVRTGERNNPWLRMNATESATDGQECPSYF
jgi:hypothetical protein